MGYNGQSSRSWWPRSRVLWRAPWWPVVALQLITLTPTAYAQNSDPNFRLRLIAELASIENDMRELSAELVTQSGELTTWRERSERLSQRLLEAEEKLERSLKDSDELRRIVSQLRSELAQLRSEFDAYVLSSTAERQGLHRQIAEITEERDTEAHARARAERTRWMFAGAGFTVGVLLCILIDTAR